MMSKLYKLSLLLALIGVVLMGMGIDLQIKVIEVQPIIVNIGLAVLLIGYVLFGIWLFKTMPRIDKEDNSSIPQNSQ